MIYLTLSVIIPCLVLQRLVAHKIIDYEKVEFSGNALIHEKRIWTLITTSLIHGSISHEINNILFTFYVAFMCESHFNIHVFWFYFSFLVPGICGWLFSFAFNVCRFGELGFFIPMRGLSPNVYGMIFFAMVAYPNESLYSSDIFANPILWSLIIHIIPQYFSTRFLKWKWTMISFLIIIIYAVMIGSFGWFSKQFTFAGFMFLYLFKGMMFDIYRLLFNENQMSTTDHTSHLCGSIIGILCGILYQLYLHLEIGQHLLIIRNAMSQLFLIISLVFLCLRFGSQFL